MLIDYLVNVDLQHLIFGILQLPIMLFPQEIIAQGQSLFCLENIEIVTAIDQAIAEQFMDLIIHIPSIIY